MKRKIIDITNQIKTRISSICGEKFWVEWYGAYEIDSKYLVIWICVQTDRTKNELQADSDLNDELRQILIENDYPSEAVSSVYIGFESQETVDRESNGNWHDHFK